MPSVLNLSCKPIPLVRIALIGIGSRGMKTLERYAYIKGAEIRYIADLSPERLELANQKLEKAAGIVLIHCKEKTRGFKLARKTI